MKKRFVALLVPIFFLLAGCLNDPVQDDLLNYVNKEIKGAAKLESKAVSAYESVTGTNYTDDQTTYDALNHEIIPAYNKFRNELDDIKIETDELKKVHEIYKEGAEMQSDAFKKIKQAIENQDANQIQEANTMLADARKLINDYKKKLNQLAKEHDVKIKK